MTTILLILKIFLFVHHLSNASAQFKIEDWKMKKSYESFTKETPENCNCHLNNSVEQWSSWSKCESNGKFTCHKSLKSRTRSCDLNDTCMEKQWKYCLERSSCEGKWKFLSNFNGVDSCSVSCGGGTKAAILLCTRNGLVGEFCEHRGFYRVEITPCNTKPCMDYRESTVKSRFIDYKISDHTDKGILSTKFQQSILIWILAGFIFLLSLIVAIMLVCCCNNICYHKKTKDSCHTVNVEPATPNLDEKKKSFQSNVLQSSKNSSIEKGSLSIERESNFNMIKQTPSKSDYSTPFDNYDYVVPKSMLITKQNPSTLLTNLYESPKSKTCTLNVDQSTCSIHSNLNNIQRKNREFLQSNNQIEPAYAEIT